MKKVKDTKKMNIDQNIHQIINSAGLSNIEKHTMICLVEQNNFAKLGKYVNQVLSNRKNLDKVNSSKQKNNKSVKEKISNYSRLVKAILSIDIFLDQYRLQTNNFDHGLSELNKQIQIQSIRKNI